ncbi:MAG: hypothetical protein U9R79_04310 [Armatimonadota bacterium]|nr:hypothetical protein [Armatimonadota bacterium]
MMSRRVFFYDDQDLETRHGLHLAYGPVRKLGLVQWPRPEWDLERASVFAGSVVELPGGGYRLYYSGRCPGGEGTFGIALAESEDGIEWTKPLLGQLEVGGADTNRIAIEGMPPEGSCTQPQVVLTPDGSWLMWSWWHAHDAGYMRYVLAESEDGVRWRVTDVNRPAVMHPADCELGQNAWVAGLTGASAEDRFAHQRTMEWMEAKRLRSNDATYVYYNEDAGRFEMYSVWLLPVDEATHRVTPHDNAPRVLRTIHRRESTDAVTWSDPEMLILADEHDPLHQELYYLAVQPDGGWNIGMLGHYRCWEQTMDLELCFSRDTHAWVRPLRGGWVPRGEIDEIDYMSIYAANRLLDMGDRWRLLYRGGNAKHNHELPEGVDEARQETFVAEAPKGRFAGLSTTNRAIGALTLSRFNHTGERITVHADVRGRLQAELRDPYGRPLPGFELNSCAPIAGDAQEHVLTWEGGKTSAEYRYDVVGLRVEMEDGVLYSIET